MKENLTAFRRYVVNIPYNVTYIDLKIYKNKNNDARAIQYIYKLATEDTWDSQSGLASKSLGVRIENVQVIWALR